MITFKSLEDFSENLAEEVADLVVSCVDGVSFEDLDEDQEIKDNAIKHVTKSIMKALKEYIPQYNEQVALRVIAENEKKIKLWTLQCSEGHLQTRSTLLGCYEWFYKYKRCSECDEVMQEDTACLVEDGGRNVNNIWYAAGEK